MGLLDKDEDYILAEHLTKRSAIGDFISRQHPTVFRLVDEEEIYHYTWEDVEAFIERCVEYCKANKIVGIYAIPRGGVILGALLSYRAGLPLLAAPIEGCLVIDDTAITGVAILPYYKRFRIAVMFLGDACPIGVDVHYPTDCEVVKFPWQK